MIRRLTILILAAALWAQPAFAWTHGSGSGSVEGPANSQLTPGTGVDYVFYNHMKEASLWSTNGGVLVPATQLDMNGYPISTGLGNYFANFFTPSQAERPGHYVQRAIGLGQINSGAIVSCTGVISSNNCTNSACSLATGSISGLTLTVTIPPGSGCGFVVGQTISYANTTFTSATYNSGTGLVTLTLAGSIGAAPGTTFTVLAAGHSFGDSGAASALNGVFTAGSGTSGTTLTYTIATGLTMTLGTGYVTLGAMSQFGTPTIIVGKSGSVNCPSCTGTGGTGTYLVNYAQTVPSGSITPGIRNEVSLVDSGATNTEISSHIVATTTGNTIQFLEFVHINDEAASWYAPLSLGSANTGLAGTLFKQRIAQGNFHTLRDLGWAGENIGIGGNNCTTWATRTPTSYVSYNTNQVQNPSLAASNVTYNSGTDTFTVTFGSGNFTDKQTIHVTWPATGTTSSKVSLNGNTTVPLLAANGPPLVDGTPPANGAPSTIIYDAALGGAMNYEANGMTCFMPPEAELQTCLRNKYDALDRGDQVGARPDDGLVHAVR